MITLLAAPGSLAPGREVVLAPEESHHLRVRRSRPGELVRLVDGGGNLATGHVVGEPSAGRVLIHTVEQRPAPPSLGLAVGAGDRERFAWLVEKAGELGVTDLIPLETEHTAGVGSRVRGDHLEKLQRRALEAIKQSGAAWVPLVHQPLSLAELAGRYRNGTRWLADAEGLPPAPPPPADPVWIVVGPEGGFSPAERQLLVDEGWMRVRLSAHTLRYETAALAAAVLAGLAR